MFPNPHAAPDRRTSKLQLLHDLSQTILASGKRLTQDQVDMLSIAISSVPLSELCLERSESCQLPEPTRPMAIGHHMDKSVDAVAAEQLRLFGQQAPTISWARPPITYLHIWEDDIMSLGVFCLPALSQIPLHDHPGMTVFTRVLYGQMHYLAYDWEDTSRPATPSHPQPARMVTDKTFRSTDSPIVLFSRTGGNLHQLTALSDCAIISLLCPPYNATEGRDCHYYRSLEEAEAGPHKGTLLQECDPPLDFYIGCGRYMGLTPHPLPATLSPTTTLEPPAARSCSCSCSPTAASSPISPHPPSVSCTMAAAAAMSAEAQEGARGSKRRGGAYPDTIPASQGWL